MTVLNLSGKKKFLIVVLSCLLTVFLTSCVPIVELNKRGLIQSIGIDYQKNGKSNKHKKFVVSFQMFNTSSAIQQDSPKSSSNNFTTRCEGVTLQDAMKRACLKQDRKIYYRVTNIIVLGRSILANPQIFRQAINFLNHTYMSSPNIYIAISDQDAADIIEAEIEQNSMPSNFIQDMLKNAEKQGYIQKTHLTDVVTSLNSPDRSVSVPIITKKKNHRKEDELKVKGIGVLNNGRFKGELLAHDVIFLRMLEDKDQKTQLAFDVDSQRYGRCDFSVIKRKTKIKSLIKQGAPFFEISLELDTNLTENSKGLNIEDFSEREIKTLESQQQQVLTRRISIILNKLLKKHRTDLLYFTNDIYRSHYDYWLAHDGDMQEILARTGFSLKVKTHIYRSVMEKSKNY